MTILETLPDEILTEVLSYLPCSDLAQTALVSKGLHAVSQSVLYRAPCVTSITGFTTPPSLQILTRTGPPSLPLFLRTLLSPGGERRAAQARSLRLKWDDIPMDWPTNLPVDVALLFASAASRFGLDLSLPSQGVQVVLLLHLLPRLRFLNLCLPIDHDGVIDLIVVFHNLPRPTVPVPTSPLALQELREFCCSSNPPAGAINSKLLLVLLGMPNMRTVDVHVIDFAFHPLPAPTPSSRVTKLRLIRSVVAPQSLKCILTSTVALTHFTYFLQSYLRHLDISHIGPALAPLRGTLQMLHFTIDKPWSISDGRATVTGSLGSFRDWPRLQTLRCPLLGLLGCGGQKDTPRLVDILPPGLRQLEVVEDRYWSKEDEREQVLSVLRLKKTVVPALEKLAMALWNGVDHVSEMDKLWSACEEAAVLLVNTSFGSSTLFNGD